MVNILRSAMHGHESSVHMCNGYKLKLYFTKNVIKQYPPEDGITDLNL